METTRCMRFAKPREGAENPKGWITPTIVEWDKLTGKQRELLGSDWGDAHPPFTNEQFFVQLYNYLPQMKGNKSDYPSIEEWMKSNRNTLLAGEKLYTTPEGGGPVVINKQGDCKAATLYSQNQQYCLKMQDDGNLVVYKYASGKQGSCVWGTQKYGFKNAYLSMQTDGNLVVYDGSNQAKWSSQTHPAFDQKYNDIENKPVKLVLENDGRLVLYSASGVGVALFKGELNVNLSIGDLIALKATNGMYVSAILNDNNAPLRASLADRIDAWERYIVVDAGNGKIGLKTDNGNYVSAKMDEAGVPVKSIADKLGTWGHFTVENLGNGKIALKANNGKYVSANFDDKAAPLRAVSDKLGTWGQFTVEKLK